MNQPVFHGMSLVGFEHYSIGGLGPGGLGFESGYGCRHNFRKKKKVTGSLGFLPALTSIVFFYNSFFVRRVRFADDGVVTIFCGPDFPILENH